MSEPDDDVDYREHLWMDDVHAIEADETLSELLAKVRSVCAEVSADDLRVYIDVHRENCHQSNCPVLTAMEDYAAARAKEML